MPTHADDLIERVCTLLRKVHKWPWRNTRALAKELKVDQTVLLNTLSQHAARPDRNIRYHPLPSGRQLDILWGLVEVVGEADDLPSLYRHDVSSEEVPSEIDPSVPLVFLSHNHQDVKPVLEIANTLRDAGIGPWLFQTGIEFRAAIIPTVRETLRRCAGLVVYVSGNSLGSLWVQKEFDFCLETLNVPALVVLDGSDEELLGCFTGRQRPKPSIGGIESYIRSHGPRQSSPHHRVSVTIAHEFAHQMHDFIESGGSVAIHPYPKPIQTYREVGFLDLSGIGKWAATRVLAGAAATPRMQS